jgi:FkbH-like protein
MQGLWWLPETVDWAERLAVANTVANLVKLAKSRLDFVQTLKLDRRLQCAIADGVIEGPPLRLAVLSSSTANHLIPGLRVAALRRGIILEVYVGAYGLFQQELSDPSSALHGFKPEAILFAFDAPHLLGTALSADKDAAKMLLDDAIARIEGAWSLATAHFGCISLQQAILPTQPPLIGGNEHRFGASPADLVRQLNFKLRTHADRASVDLVSVDHWALLEGLDTWHNPVLWHGAKQDISPAVSPVFGDLVMRAMDARCGRSAKCLILDLDNTLWGGVIGDEGLDGIVLGPGSAAGEAFSDFQRYAKALTHRGIILAVCSKNDLTTAMAAFEKHPEMTLRTSDIAAFSVNWQDKATNIRQIANDLGLGLDALVFADDNPFERNIVRVELPMVMVPELPDEPALYARCLSASGYFEAADVTAEDAKRTSLYRARSEEAAARRSTTDLAGYLASLQMQLHWSPFQRVDLQRITQLSNKTNQFNLRTQRYTEAEIASLLDRKDALTLQFRLLDRFADHGIIALVIGGLEEEATLHIETWLMSCRVLGRGVEEAVTNLIFQEAARLNAEYVAGEYIPSSKNAMVAGHYGRLGFAETNSSPDATRWLKSVVDHQPLETHIAVKRI